MITTLFLACPLCYSAVSHDRMVRDEVPIHLFQCSKCDWRRSITVAPELAEAIPSFPSERRVEP